MTVAPFSHDFGDEFASLLADVERPTPLIGPQIDLIPFDYVSAEPTLPVAFHSFNELRDNYAYPTFDALAAQTDYPDFDHIMQGHPGFPGGPSPMPSGSGLALGYHYLGVDWWITEAEGIEDSAGWRGAVVDPAGADGSWPAGVYAPGREITINVTLAADTAEELAAAKTTAAAALSVPPRRGWLTYRNRRISVQLDGPIRVKSRGSHTADVQVKLRGVDVGTAGAGAHFEDAAGATTYNLAWNYDDEVLLDGALPSPPLIEVVGPTPVGVRITVGGTSMELLESLTLGARLTIDARRRRVLLDSLPRLSAVNLNQWPLMTVGANRLLADAPGGTTPTGLVRVSATALY